MLISTRPPSVVVPVPTRSAPRASSHSIRRWRLASSEHRLYRSVSTPRLRRGRRSKRPYVPSMIWSRPASSVTWAARGSGWHLMKSLAVAGGTAGRATWRIRRTIRWWAGIRVGIDAAGPSTKGVGCVVLEPAGIGTAHRPHPPRLNHCPASRLQSSVATSAGPQVSEVFVQGRGCAGR